jgi:Ca2+/H+ antiporter
VPSKEDKVNTAGGNILRLFLSLNVLLIFIPLALYLEHSRPQAHTLIFFSACLGIIPLAGWMGKATEQIADRAGEGIGGLLNATFGNASDGKSNWFTGLLLLMVYLVLAVAFFHVPG